MRSNQNTVNEFLKRTGWSFAGAIAEDGAARRYNRVRKNNQTAILMTVYGDTPGHRIEDFIRIGQWLRDIGLSAPEIYKREGNLLLLEDFGDISFKSAPDYQLAGDVLEHLSAQKCPLDLVNYYDSHVHKARRRIIDWYMPALRGEKNSDGLVESYLAVWDGIEKSLPPCPQNFLHIDFHAENLMILPGREGIKKIGILDFQGGMIGPAPYDLGNLLEDIRTDVPGDIREKLLAGKDELYLSWYRVLTTQFHCRVMGQIIRWAVKDGKTKYMDYLPRTAAYLQKALAEPVLSPLKAFFSAEGIDFTDVKDLNSQNIAKNIRDDAF